MTIAQYIDNINQRYLLGNATEHTFRGDLQQLIESLIPDVQATNEPKRQSCGAPDYILTKKEIPVGFIEAKDIGDKDLEGKKKTGNKEQFDRYRASLTNLIFTDYLDFHLYDDGVLITKISIAKVTDKGIVAIPENFANFENLLKDFCTHVGQTIKSSKKLAEMMAGKARLLSDVIEKSLTSDEDNAEDSTLKDQMNAFKSILIHDITAKGFADVYAQTIAYGMFAARLHDPTLDTFSRQEAAELIPKSNPFLRKLFGYIAGPDIDDRIKWIVDNLTEIFMACNVEDILKNYGKSTKMEDPIIHFYETFLAEYDPKLRKARGVWYTPAPVVNFIVRAVDDILKTEFDLPQGLADKSKTTIKVNSQTPDNRSATGYKQVDKEVHKVQILDPATGTGTFLAEVIKHVNKKFKGQEGIWSSYVENDLLPRLNGFELLMASYAMAHLQLDLLLKETGFKPTRNQRTKVYLTNSLEEAHPDAGTLFANWLSSEANEANYVKSTTPVMCIIGNPPYSGESANKGEWIMKLMEDYKKEPGCKEKLKERNSKTVNDDYVKFIRYGQYFVQKNKSGIVAFINPHGYLDSATFRGMRWHLLNTFDKIYTIDLHGNSKKQEKSPDGSPDINVFDIMQGVSINIFIKNGNKKPNSLAQVYHKDVFGKRDYKYAFLSDNSLKSIDFTQLPNVEPNYFMVPKNFIGIEDYKKGLSLSTLFQIKTSGVKTHRDAFVIDKSKSDLGKRILDFFDKELSNETILSKYPLKAKEDWLNDKRNNEFETDRIVQINYRPFDIRWIYYSPKLVDRGREKIFNRTIDEKNIGLLTSRQLSTFDFQHIFISRHLADMCSVSLQTKETGYYFPLYINSKEKNQQSFKTEQPRTPNLDPSIVKQIADKLGLIYNPNPKNPFETGKDIILKAVKNKPNGSAPQSNHSLLNPIDILDYIYAVLHSPSYREKYKEFLKIDFPRVPYPKDQDTFWQLVQLGSEIRQIHLLESAVVEDYITTYPKGGSNEITTKVAKKDWELIDTDKQLGRIWLNENQYFDNIPLVAWEFYIGGYQPAQKWLKDRRGRILEFDDILHYQKIIVALSETDRLMKEIDNITIA